MAEMVDQDLETSSIARDADNIDDMYLTFQVENEEYGVEIAHVTEIVSIQRIMSVPDVPSFIKGVINLRGKVIPVMDIRARFGMPEAEYDERTVVVVLEVRNIPIGLVVDGVREVREIPGEAIDEPPHWKNNDLSAALIKGIGHQEGAVTILINAEGLMEEDDAQTESGQSPMADAAA